MSVSEFLILYPVYILAENAEQNLNTLTLTLSKNTKVVTCGTTGGNALVAFTDLDAANAYLESSAVEGDFVPVGLGMAEFTCVLARVGIACEILLLDYNPKTGFGRTTKLEPIRQQLSVKLQAAVEGMDL